MRYSQDQNFNIKGPGLPEQGVVAVGPAELEKAFEAGCRLGVETGQKILLDYANRMRFGAGWASHKANKQP